MWVSFESRASGEAALFYGEVGHVRQGGQVGR
jgi:hypothetical protein